jgi:hypothetical protein
MRRNAIRPDSETSGPPSVRKRRGRPPKRPAWLAFVAELAAQGVTLRKALRRYGVPLSRSQRRNVYRWRAFKAMMESYRAAPEDA